MSRGRKSRFVLQLGSALCVAGLVPAAARAGAFLSANDLIVERLSSGTGAVAVHLDEYSTTGGVLTSVGNTIDIASSGASALTMTLATNHDGNLHLASDGQSLVLGGYRTTAGSADPVSTSVARVIGVVNASGVVDTSTALTDAFVGVSFRSVASDGTRFWVAGDNGNSTTTGGIRYVSGIGATTSTDIINAASVNTSATVKTANVRDVNIFNGNLYAGSGSSSIAHASFQVGTGLPTAANSASFSILNTDGQDGTNVFLADLSAGVAGNDTLYIEGKDSFAKYSLVSGSWVSNGSFKLSASIPFPQPEKFAARLNGTAAQFFIGTDTAIYGYTDTSGYNAALNGTLSGPLLTVTGSDQFRGISFAPVPEPASLSLLATAGGALLRRRGRKA